MRTVVWMGSFPAGLLGSLAGTIVLLPPGLIAHEMAVYSLALGTGALLGALGAGWAATLLARDGSCSRLLSVVAATQAAAIALALVV